ncbi:hypothetical protein [Nonomuraea sp. NPDC049750]|uniref:hypothetical protein n=1 Tax=Nonomuraea sp. NPDC049750 TaxID=3154738 RepID=UPI0033D51B8A
MSDTDVMREHIVRALRRQPSLELLQRYAEGVLLDWATAACGPEIKKAIETVLAERDPHTTQETC